MKRISGRRPLTRAGIALLALIAVAAVQRQVPAATPPTFVHFASEMEGAGEPSIGVNWSTGAVMYQSGDRTARVGNFNETAKTANWVDVTPDLNLTFDPVLFTDHLTNRTFVGHLYLACSELSFTDDDGQSWTPNPLGCAPGSVLDHETVGGGPLPPPFAGVNPLYPNAVYYCTHALVEIGCGASLDGGLTFNPASPIRGCGGGHGHLVVDPDGTAFLPHSRCNGQQALITSANAGLTWTKLFVPDSAASNEGDPAVGVGDAGSLYFGYQSETSSGSVPKVSVSHDHGTTWSPSINVGASLGIKNIQFPSMVAGDDDKAAFAFLGTTTAGDDQSPSFAGKWHLYVSTTYDGGATWSTVDATPTDPVQIGQICMQGITCSSGRNLLDFMGIDIDNKGRIYVAYADGCIACTDAAGSYRSLATIARQSGGTDLIAVH